MPKKKDINWLHELASSRGGKCLSVEYINNKTKYEWECGKCGYRWWAKANNIDQGQWCPKCAGNIQKNIDWLYEVASLRGGKCLSTEYINNNTKYEWECGKCGHRWFAKANSIQQGHWCPKCAVQKRASLKCKDISYLHKLASLKGGRCLSSKYNGMLAKYEWECNKEHGWEAKANDIQQGYWCPECAVQKRAIILCNDINWLHELASQNGGGCLSTEYINSKTKYEWTCEEGHRFFMLANSVQQGQWCPHCTHKHSKAELQIYEFVKELYPDALNGKRKLLINPKFELDIYIPSLKKAIEFDGRFWHSTDEVQLRDLRKNQECEAKGIKLLRIQEQDFINSPQKVFDVVRDFLQN